MTITWKYDGNSLTSYGVVTVLNDYLDIPQRRGENISLPFNDGTFYVPKFYDQRIITIGMAIVSNTATEQDTIFDNLKKLFGVRSQKVLQYTREDATIYNANASVDAPIQTERIHDTFARIAVEFVLNQPFFRLSTQTSTIITIDASPKTGTVANGGTFEERNPTITLTGPLTNPVITNITNGVSLTYTGVISAGHTVIITQDSTGQYTATHSVSGNVIGKVTHSGDTALMVLAIGNNSMSITSSVATTGEVKFEFYPPYL